MKCLKLILISMLFGLPAFGLEDPQVLKLASEQLVPKKQTVTLTVNLPQSLLDGKQVRLVFMARVQYGDCANNAALAMTVNGKNIVGNDLLNKPLEYLDKNGRDSYWALPKDRIWYLYSWSNFSLKDAWASENPYSIPPSVNPFEFSFDITPYVRAGNNTLTFTHSEILANVDSFVDLQDVRIEVGSPLASNFQAAVQPAPTGPLPTYVPQEVQNPPMEVQLGSGGNIRVQLSGHSFDLVSRTSQPEGKWSETSAGEWHNIDQGSSATVQWSCGDYKISRKVEVKTDHIHVYDTFINTSNKLVGVMYENRVLLKEKPLETKLAGEPAYDDGFHNTSGGTNPTALARWKDLAIGLVAEDDIFRSHAMEFATADAFGLADHELGIGPRILHTLEWSIYPVPHGDYWDFINAIRRNWGANFCLNGPNVFVNWSTEPIHDKTYYANWLKTRHLNIVASSDAMSDEGYAAMGTAIPTAKAFCAHTAAWINQVHLGAPGVKALVYMNGTLSTEASASTKYADSRQLDSSGMQYTMAAGGPRGLTMAPLFISTLTNSYGKAMMTTAKFIINTLHADGLYHDVFCFGDAFGERVVGAAWDGCTVVIDPKTHEVKKKDSSVVLLQQSWEVALVKYLRDRDKIFLANGPVETRTLLNLKIPVFVETASSFSEVYKTHLGSPLGYGNHPPPDPGQDVYHQLAYEFNHILDYGGILSIPSWPDEPKGLTFLNLIYPITPIDLRAGTVFGKERILTNRSGRYGWSDNSGADVYVFDGDGKLVSQPLVKEVLEDQKRYFEIRMPSNDFAILVRKPE